MMTRPICDLFESDIFPGFPFRNKTWRAVGFERNDYDGTRMPEWFFRAASKHFNPHGNIKLLIIGDLFVLDGRVPEVVEISFDWETYRSFMQSRDGFSLEYKIASDDGQCACWADPELTIFGGAADKMTTLFDDYGGANSVLASIEKEFFLDEVTGNEDMRKYFRGLLFPDQRS